MARSQKSAPILSDYLATHTHTVSIDGIEVTYSEEPPTPKKRIVRMSRADAKRLTSNQLMRLFPDTIIIEYGTGSHAWPAATTLFSQKSALEQAGLFWNDEWDTGSLESMLIPGLLKSGFTITIIMLDA